MAEELRKLLSEDRACPRQLSKDLIEQGALSVTHQIRRHLKRTMARYRWTASILKHKQDSAKAGQVLSKLKEGGRLDRALI